MLKQIKRCVVSASPSLSSSQLLSAALLSKHGITLSSSRRSISMRPRRPEHFKSFRNSQNQAPKPFQPAHLQNISKYYRDNEWTKITEEFENNLSAHYDPISYTQIMKAYFKSGQKKKAIELLYHLIEKDSSGSRFVDQYVVCCVIDQLVAEKDFEELDKVFSFLQQHQQPILSEYFASILRALRVVRTAKEERWENHFVKMVESHQFQNHYIITAENLMITYAHRGELDKMLELFRTHPRTSDNVYTKVLNIILPKRQYAYIQKMLDILETRSCGVFIYTSILNHFIKCGELEIYESTLNAIKGRFPPEQRITLYNPMLNWYCENNKLDEAEAFLLRMRQDNLSPSYITYSTLIKGYCLNNRTDKAIELIHRLMRRYAVEDQIASKEGSKMPNPILTSLSFLPIVKTLCDKKDVEAALDIIKGMESLNLQPTAHVYNCILHYYAQEEQMDKAMSFFDEMNAKGVIPMESTFRTLLVGLYKVREFKAARRLKKMWEEYPNPNKRRV